MRFKSILRGAGFVLVAVFVALCVRDARAAGPAASRIQGKAARVRSLIGRAPPGANIQSVLRRMKRVKAYLDNREFGKGEALLDEVLADLESADADFRGRAALHASAASAWSTPERVRISGYDKPGDHKMEIGVSADGRLLFFNNSNKRPGKTDLYYAVRVGNDDTSFKFRGPIQGANKPRTLDATPAYDDDTQTLSFVSSRVRPPALHWGSFKDGKLHDVALVPISFPKPHYGIGMEMGRDMKNIFFTYRSRRDKDYMDISLAHWDGRKYVVPRNWRRIMANVNTGAMEYAPEVSSDLLEIWFTRVVNRGRPIIYSAVRKNTKEPFTSAAPHPAITGLVEAATLTGDDNTMYYHCRDMRTETWEVCVTRRQQP